jgi:coenzyme F420-0:L-glutamate ligase/coenzyme F420-1:gamma-L-glutamate ligase
MDYPKLTFSAIIGLPLIHQGDDLGKILDQAFKENQIKLTDGDVLILAQKIISKAEGRLVDLHDVEVSPEAIKLAQDTGKDPRLVELILRESTQVIRSRPGLLIVEHRLGFICANAGIDRSNIAGIGEEKVLLLPEDPEKSAKQLRGYFQAAVGVQIGVLIIDSHGRPWRNGTVGISIGFSGIPGLVDLRGEVDIFGYKLQSTVIGAVDELAAGASLIMGQAAEGTPVVHARGFPYPLREGSFKELPRDISSDLFR